MPYNLFLTVRRSDEFSKAKAVFVGQGGQSELVLNIEDPEFWPAEEIVRQLMKAIVEHMEVRRAAQRRDA